MDELFSFIEFADASGYLNDDQGREIYGDRMLNIYADYLEMRADDADDVHTHYKLMDKVQAIRRYTES